MPRTCGRDCLLRPRASSVQREEALKRPKNEELDQKAVAKILYSSIKPWQTRLLVLREGALGTPVEGELVVVDLIHADGVVLHDKQQLVTYIALSYTWFDVTVSSKEVSGAASTQTIADVDRFPQRISLNGRLYSISTNLFCFLQRYRQRMTSPYLWVDSISINQHDNDEKAFQVAGMLNIYKKADQVLIWLGEAGSNTDLAMEYIRAETAEDLSHSKSCEKRKKLLINGLHELYSRPWIMRIWIRQEVWASRKLTVLCGTRQISWRLFQDGSYFINGGPDDPRQSLADAASRDTAAEVVQSLSRRARNELAEIEVDQPIAPLIGWKNNPHDIVTLLNRTLSCQMTDERDRLYAQLGMTNLRPRAGARLASYTDELDLRVDYGRPLTLVFQDLARYIMGREKSVASILCLSATFGSNLGDGALPSWAIDWRRVTSYQPYLYFEKLLRGKRITSLSRDDKMFQRLQEASGNGDSKVMRDSGLNQSESDTESEWSTDNESQDSSVASSIIDVYPCDSKVTTVPWNGPLEDDSGVLSLRGRLLATVTSDLPATLSLHRIDLMYRTKKDRKPQFEKESNLAARVQRELHTYQESQIKRLQDSMAEHGSFVMEVPGKKQTRKVNLRARDISIVVQQRQIVPVSDSDHFLGWQQKSLWGSVKFVQVEASGDQSIVDTETKASRLFLRFALRDHEQKVLKSKDFVTSTDEDVWGTDDGSATPYGSDLSDGSEGSTDANLSGLSDSDEDRDDEFRHYSGKVLNREYNEHFPSEFAVPVETQIGDHIVVVEGSALPLVLRPCKGVQERSFSFVGLALLDNQLHIPNFAPQRQRPEKYDLVNYHRLQLSAYEHFQLSLRKALREGTCEEFNIV